jgi:hypothetical protein
MYPLWLELDGAQAEHHLRLERAQRRALLAEARQAHLSARGHPRLGTAPSPLRIAAGLLRAASASLAALADALERPLGSAQA